MPQESIIFIFIAASYINYYFVTLIFHRMRIMNVVDTAGVPDKLKLLNVRHCIGIFFFGFIFIIIYPSYLGLLTDFSNFDPILLISTIILAFACAMISLNAARKQKFMNISKSLKQHHKTEYIGVRAIFLLAYEFFFRGVLLFSVMEKWGVTVAILINLVTYVVIHMFDSRKEIIGCIPFGLVLCLLCYQSESILPAFIIHGSLSITYEAYLLKTSILKTKNI